MINFIKHFKNQLFIQEVGIFVLAQFLGILAAQKIDLLLSQIEVSLKEVTVIDFAIYFLIGTVFVILFSGRSKISNVAMHLFFILTLFLGVNFFFTIFINPMSAFYFALALIAGRFIFPSIFLHNLTFLLTISAFSPALALRLSAISIVILLAALAVYDIVAVYFTKHMVKMAEAMIERKLIFGFIIPEKIRYNFWGVEKAKPGMGVIFLGGGDVGLPLFLVASVAAVDLIQGIIVAMFATVGLILSYYLFVSQKLKKPMPALPPISLFTILGYFAVKVLWG